MNPEDVQKLKNWLEEQHLTVTSTSKNGTSVYVRATAAQLETSLHVEMVQVTKDGISYTAARNAPSLPVDVGTAVQAIIGLQPYKHASKNSREFLREPAPIAAAPHTAPAPAPAIASAPPYLVKEVLKAYNAEALGVTGAGQTIGILIDTFASDEDTQHFWSRNELPTTPNRVTNINVKNVSPLPATSGEESMDVQWTSGIASKAKIRVYAASSLAFVDLDLALDKIIEDATADPSLKQVSISLGLGEQFLSPDGARTGEIQIEDDKFLTLAGMGVNVFVSSGDGGSNPTLSGGSGGAFAQTEWMSSSPNVIGVGGTSLQLKAGGDMDSETGWPGSGGGISRVFGRPAFQSVLTLSGTNRLVPDVSLLADPATGAYVRVNGVDRQIGGTSLSAPAWAGFCALMNEARAKAHKPALPFLNPILYMLDDEECFRDVIGNKSGEFEAVSGYDMVTGLGVPNIQKIIEKVTQ